MKFAAQFLLVCLLSLVGCGPAAVVAGLTSGGSGGTSTPQPTFGLASFCENPILVPGSSLPLRLPADLFANFPPTLTYVLIVRADCDGNPGTTGDQTLLYQGSGSIDDFDEGVSVPIPVGLCGTPPQSVSLVAELSASPGTSGAPDSATLVAPNFFSIREPEQFLFAGGSGQQIAESITRVDDTSVWVARYSNDVTLPLPNGFDVTFFSSGMQSSPPNGRSFLCGVDANAKVSWYANLESSAGVFMRNVVPRGAGKFTVNGFFRSNLTLAGELGPVVLQSASQASQSACELVWATYSTDGKLLEVAQSLGNNSCQTFPRAMAPVGPLGSEGFVSSARIQGSVTIPGQYTQSGLPLVVNSTGDNDCYLARFGSNGRVIWQQAFGSAGYDGPIDVKVSESGLLFVSGEFHGPSATFGIGSPSFALQTSLGSQCSDWRYDGVLAALTLQSGQFQWAARLSGFDRERGQEILVRDDHVFWIAQFEKLIQATLIDAGNVEYPLIGTSANTMNSVLAEFDQAGMIQRPPRVFSAAGAGGTCALSAIRGLPDGDLLIGGYFRGQLDLGNGTPKLTSVAGPGGESVDVFVARVSVADGYPVRWVWHGGAPDNGTISCFGPETTDSLGGLTLMQDSIRVSVTSGQEFLAGIGGLQGFVASPKLLNSSTNLLLLDLNLDGTKQFDQ